MQFLDHGVEVETLELRRVVERLTHRIGQRGVPMENRKVQRVRPPVTVCVSMGERALARALVVSLCVHVSLRSCSVIFFGHSPLRRRLAALVGQGERSGLIVLFGLSDKAILSR